MSRRARHHDKLLREYLTVRRARAAAENDGESAARIERLAVRERTLAASLRWIRVELDLPERFDPDAEAERLGIDEPRQSRQPRRRRRSKATPELFPERRRVKPVPAWFRATERREPETFDLETGLVVLAAKHCARKAAEELLEHRAAMIDADRARVDADDDVVLTSWPERPLDRTPNGQIYAGSAGRLMGELAVRADDGEAELERARIAVRCYLDEFTACVVAALDEERAAAADDGSADDAVDDSGAFGLLLQRELANAACARIAVEARAARAGTSTSCDDVAALGNAETRPPELPASATAVTAEVDAVRPAGDARPPLRLLRHG